jgi:ribosomal protein S18 acetylase RimI-like enzyme
MENIQTTWKLQPYSAENLAEVVEVVNSVNISLFGVPETDAEEFAADLSLPGFDPSKDAICVFDPAGQMLGFAGMWNLNKPGVRRSLHWWIRPEADEPALNDTLLEWLAERASQNLEEVDAELRVMMNGFPFIKQHLKINCLERHGFTHVRSTYSMLRIFDQAPEKPEIPEGITIRPLDGSEADWLLAAQADFEAFKDHYGKIPEPFEHFYTRMKHRIDTTPGIVPQACFLAFEGDQVAGLAINNVKQVEFPQRGWVDNLGVCKPYRKRGVGLALLLTSFNEFHQRGLTEAGLGVDAGSLTGALRLYQRAGMEIETEWLNYEKEIRPGKDIVLRSLD